MALEFWQAMDIINQQYPQFIPFLSIPGVFQILVDAVSNPSEWSPERIQAAMGNTDWYKNTDPGARKLQLMLAADPAGARYAINEADRMVRDAQFDLGINIDPTTTTYLALNAAAHGWDQARILAESAGYAQQPAYGNIPPGLVADAINKIQDVSEDYAVTINGNDRWWWGVNIAAGVHPMEQFETYAQQQAMALYPALRPFLSQGGTVRQFAEPYLAMAEKELGLAGTRIDLRDSKWLDVFLSPGENGEQAIRSQTEALHQIRSDPRYGYDTGQPGRTQAATFATQLMKQFGAMG